RSLKLNLTHQLTVTASSQKPAARGYSAARSSKLNPTHHTSSHSQKPEARSQKPICYSCIYNKMNFPLLSPVVTPVDHNTMEIGISTFVENTPDPSTGAVRSPYERMQNLMEEIELADQVGLDVFAIGEHHRPDFIVSSPAVVLAAAAVRTKNIRLSSAVTVLSSDDPVRVFQDFAHVDLLSGGRAEIDRKSVV